MSVNSSTKFMNSPTQADSRMMGPVKNQPVIALQLKPVVWSPLRVEISSCKRGRPPVERLSFFKIGRHPVRYVILKRGRAVRDAASCRELKRGHPEKRSSFDCTSSSSLVGRFQYLCLLEPVKIIDPHLVSSFFDNYKRVYLHATTELENRSSWTAECSLSIHVTTELEGSIHSVEQFQTQNVSIPPTSRVQYTYPELFFHKPNLWWPNGMGKQSLYNVIINVDVKGYGESDSWSHHFGFRKIESHIDDATGGRLFKVNGGPIFIRGGNWILSNGLLRLSKKRYETDIKFHADMNFNMIRCWGGGLTERPEFYHYFYLFSFPFEYLCIDVAVWQEFWITGDVDGRGIPVSNPNGPLDHDLFLFCARDTVKLPRNHPSLALWVGGNEQTPPDDINTALKNDLKLHPYFRHTEEKEKPVAGLSHRLGDPSQYLDGTRIYIQGSLWDGLADGEGNFTDGPYEIQNPVDFFKDDFYKYGFNPEVGSVGMPVAGTIRATMPSEGWQIPLFNKLSSGYVEEVPNPIWKYHKYIPYANPTKKVNDQIELYGNVNDLDDFCLKAQLVNYIQYRALLEGWTSHMWKKFTGVLIWKTQNPWTGLRGQFYDHLLDQTAGFFGCRCAAEPIHVQLNLATYFIEVVNTTSEELSNIAVEVSVRDLEGTCPHSKVHENLTALPKNITPIVEMEYPKTKNPKPLNFLILEVYNMSDNTKSKEVGWFRRIHKCFAGKSAGVKVSEINGQDIGVAFFLHFSVHASNKDHKEGEDTRILPVHYSDNYFSLVPGETMTIKISFEVPPGVSPLVTLHGWNFDQQAIHEGL
ncbi:unnamed protein product [Sphenostylis stenocarpa]|uniref:Mannosylglycoprotein endo-beta-mannosidase n=1 Tax=Sphenostylis stenocarpa TaxID=92480 RepID=A0AA86VUH8_9FABA|nr:unnamed protein product [Sphenostylis stenocarpa]